MKGSSNEKFVVPVKFIDIEDIGFNCKKCVLNERIDYLKELKETIDHIRNGGKKRTKAIWLETSGCYGEIISLLNGEDPDIIYMLKEIIDIHYFGSINGNEGEVAYERILEVLQEEYIFIVSGAIPTRDNGLYTVVANYKGEKITAMKAVSDISKGAKYVIAVGTCACYGGPTAAKPNVSQAKGVSEYLNRKDIINIPGCPVNPCWLIAILGYLVRYGKMQLDAEGRPIAYYGYTIHEKCERRRFFDAGIFAEKFGEDTCMFKLGCKGPMTYAYCPISRWNEGTNWPIGDNTNCIGCAASNFPDWDNGLVNYGGKTI